MWLLLVCEVQLQDLWSLSEIKYSKHMSQM